MSATKMVCSAILTMAATAGWAGAGTCEPVHPVEVDLSALAAAAGGRDGTLTAEPAETELGVTNLGQEVHFDSIDSNECCGGITVVPSDPDIAVGPDHVLVGVNMSLEIYNTTGASLVGPVQLTTFFTVLGGDCANFAYNPSALYDEDAGRFILGADGNGTTFCVGVSQTADPTGAWYLYAIPANVGGAFFDWPHAGVGRDAIYLGATMVGTGLTGRVWALDKAAMYAGGATTVITQDLGAYIRPQPLHLHGAADGSWPQSGPHYFLSLTDPPEPGSFTYHLWSDPFGANTFVTVGDLDVAAAHGVAVSDAIDFPQAGGTDIQGRPDFFSDFEFRNGSGWTTNHVSCLAGGNPVDCVQWAEIILDSGTIAQAGVFASTGIFRTYPDLAVNACGDMAVGYTRSSAAIFPGIGAAGRQAGDPPGTLQDEVVAKDGEVPYDAFNYRWGEYTGMTVDPAGNTFWYAGVYSKNNGNLSANWGTYVSSFEFPPCTNDIFADGFESGDTSAWSNTVP